MPPDAETSKYTNASQTPGSPAAGGAAVVGPSRRGLRLFGLGAGALLVLVLGVGAATRVSHSKSVREWTATEGVPDVSVAKPRSTGGELTLDLPGRLDAYYTAPIFARVSGYLKSWQTDIGTPVKAGQQLGEIEAPDLDQQLMQARADLATAQANETLSATTAKRWRSMLGTDAVSQQEVDDRNGDYAAKQAMLKAARANLERLTVLEGFKRLVAPFDGIVTARYTDVGALINAGSGARQPLFVVSDERRLRIYVNVPQSYITQIKPGLSAQVSVPERPGQVFTGTVERSAEAVDFASSTTLIQIVVNNENGALKPGAYANVRFNPHGGPGSFKLPASALIYDQSGLHVATVDANGRLVMKEVTIAQDLGATVEIATGLTANDRVVENPPDSLVAGETVRIVGGASKTPAVATSAPRSGG